MKRAICFGPFRLDPESKQLCRGLTPIPLAPKTFELLQYLAERPGVVISRDKLFDALWPGTYVDDHALSVQIREIRKALGDSAQRPRYIETRHRLGYCFKGEVRVTGAAQQSVASGAVAAAPAVIRDFTPPETRYAQSGNVNIAYQVLGDGPTDLIFVMGWVSHLEYFWTEPRFARFLQRLASFSRLILFDKRGTGMSDRVPLDQLPTLEQRMEDLHAVMDATASERPVICGVSEGGCMSAVFAATYPHRTRGLVMIGTYAKRLWDPDYPWAPRVEERDRFLEEIRTRWGGPVGIEDRARSLAQDPGFRDWWAAYLRMGASPGAALALTQMNTEVDIRDVLPLVHAPALVIHRAQDPCLKIEEGRYVAGRLPNARFIEVPGEDHLPFVGDQEPILRAVEKFVHELDQQAEHRTVLATVLAVQLTSGGATALRAHASGQRATHLSAAGEWLIAAFDGPARAARCAASLRQLAQRDGAKFAAGLHTGECSVGDSEQLAGPAVELAQMLARKAAPGELLATGTVRDLAAGSGIGFERCGRLRVKELGEWELLRVPA